MADRFQKEISSAMRGQNNPSVDSVATDSALFPLKKKSCVFTEKLTGVLPILSPGAQGAPLPKVAAHVTGVGSLAGPPAADGEDSSMKDRNEISAALSTARYVWHEALECVIDILKAVTHTYLYTVYMIVWRACDHRVASPRTLRGQRWGMCLRAVFRLSVRTCRCAAALSLSTCPVVEFSSNLWLHFALMLNKFAMWC